jgi:hypothetical protein
MSNNPTQAPTQFYGFTSRKRHFEWQQPTEPQRVEEQSQATSNDSAGGVSDAELTNASAVGATQGSPAQQGWELKREKAPSAVGAADGSPAREGWKPHPPQEAAPPAASHSKEPRSNSPRRRRRRTKALAHTPESLLLSYHTRNCAICGSECEDEIEDAFLNWESVDTIARSYAIQRRSVYRHAHATGLFARRDRNIRRALGLLIHRADKVRDVSADSIIRAAKTLAHLNEQGEWVVPIRRVIVSYGAPTQLDTTCRLRTPQLHENKQ